MDLMQPDAFNLKTASLCAWLVHFGSLRHLGLFMAGFGQNDGADSAQRYCTDLTYVSCTERGTSHSDNKK